MEDTDWDLQAVVRGYTNTIANATTRTNSSFMADLKHVSPSSSCSINKFVVETKDDSLLWFPDSSSFEEPRRNFVEELQELYKPFFPKSSPSPQIQRGSINQHQQQLIKQSCTVSTATATIHSQSTRSKRRKNQMKKVFQVPAEGLASDTWSWRKYGQKPIKGSPYPRGYYRCSSSKGCLARKQVERNRSDPTMFIITYTAEHNHPVPTHRNSLAGTTRLQRQPSSPPSSSSSIAVESSSNNNSNPLTTATKPSSCSSDEISLHQSVVKMEDRVEFEDGGEEDDDEPGFSDMAMSDDFFDGLDEIAGPMAVTGDFFSDNAPASFIIPWMANNAAAAAGSS